MTQAICIDFGTSSIRAALRGSDDQLSVLPLGQLAGERLLDGASLVSDICVDREAACIFLGEKAYDVSRRRLGDVYVKRSAKLWLKEPSTLAHIEVPEYNLTREELLVCLLAYALSTILKATPVKKLSSKLSALDIRVAHPIWERGVQETADDFLIGIAAQACALADYGFQNPISINDLRAFSNKFEVASKSTKVDVVEPIAAAQQLIPRIENSLKIVAVVDVGAGTTDLGLFKYKEPDFSRVRVYESAIVPLAEARSVLKAGDLIDQVLLRLLFERAGQRMSVLDQREAEAEIRRYKEELFKTGTLSLYGKEFRKEEVEADEAIKNYAREVRACLKELILKCTEAVRQATINTAAQSPFVEIIMAGGGASLSFLVEELKQPLQVGNLNVAFKVVKASPASSLSLFEANIARLAVALGGVDPAYDSLRREYAKSWQVRSLGGAKQTF